MDQMWHAVGPGGWLTGGGAVTVSSHLSPPWPRLMSPCMPQAEQLERICSQGWDPARLTRKQEPILPRDIFLVQKKKCCPSEGSKYILLRIHVIFERRGLVPIPYPAHPLACTRHPQSAFLARGAPPARDAVGETGSGNGSF